MGFDVSLPMKEPLKAPQIKPILKSTNNMFKSVLVLSVFCIFYFFVVALTLWHFNATDHYLNPIFVLPLATILSVLTTGLINKNLVSKKSFLWLLFFPHLIHRK